MKRTSRELAPVHRRKTTRSYYSTPRVSLGRSAAVSRDYSPREKPDCRSRCRQVDRRAPSLADLDLHLDLDSLSIATRPPVSLAFCSRGFSSLRGETHTCVGKRTRTFTWLADRYDNADVLVYLEEKKC